MKRNTLDHDTQHIYIRRDDAYMNVLVAACCIGG